MGSLCTPRDLGYRMPAEWEPHAATWLVWPQNATDWPGKFASIAWVYADIIRWLSQGEIVHLVVNGPGVEERASRVLRKTGIDFARICFHQWPTNRGWTRDAGPIFVRSESVSKRALRASMPSDERSLALTPSAKESVAVTDWGFNAWAKYGDWSLDNQLPSLIARYYGLPVWTPQVRDRSIVLEGGSIDVNGAGVMITTEECQLSAVQQRNPGIDRAELEIAFRDYLGIEKVIWLDRGIAGDDTHGHVDDITRFVAVDTIVTAVEPDPSDANHEPLRDNLARLREAVNIDGRPFRIVELPMPSPVVFNGQRIPASYANFYIANGIVLVPTFNDPNDRLALSILAELFPERRVVGIHSRDLIWGLGAIHCMTQQQPA